MWYQHSMTNKAMEQNPLFRNWHNGNLLSTLWIKEESELFNEWSLDNWLSIQKKKKEIRSLSHIIPKLRISDELRIKIWKTI